MGKFDRSQMKEVDNAIAIVKEAKAETEKALEVRKIFKAHSRLEFCLIRAVQTSAYLLISQVCY